MSEVDEYPCMRWVVAKDLRRAEWNPRTLANHKEGIAGRSIDYFGWIQPLTYNAKTKTLLDGHMRLQEVEEDVSVPVYMVWVEREQEQAVAVALNNEYGEWVHKGVQEEMTVTLPPRMTVTVEMVCGHILCSRHCTLWTVLYGLCNMFNVEWTQCVIVSVYMM